MIDPNANKQPKPQTVVVPKSSTGNVATITDTLSSSSQDRTQDRTKERAYELYESRGREHGQDEQDWFRAEQEILKRKR
jgi:hypothetical protein